MARSDKTEQATPQRRNEARQKGQIAKSAEVSVLAGLAMAALAMRVFVPTAVGAMDSATTATFGHLSDDPAALAVAGRAHASAAVAVLVPFLGAGVLGALASGFSQTRFAFSLQAAKPKLSALDPRNAAKRFAPAKAGWELTRTAVKLGALIAVAWEPMTRLRERLTSAAGLGIDTVLDIVAGEVWTILLRSIALAFVLAGADYLYQRWQFNRDLRMSKTEVKQDNKNSEGDPILKGERRRRQQALSRNRMLADVGQADVVLVNPTDYAIALRYEPGLPAPKVLAKGADHLAAKIRAEAARHGVPVHTDVPLCRALYRQVEVGGYIPQAMFDAIAVVLVWAYRRSGRRPTNTGNDSRARRVAVAAGGTR